MSVRADVETIRKIPIFSECEPAHLQLLSFSAIRESFQSGMTLMVQGETGTAAFLILNGSVEILTAENGSLGQVGPGAFLGEVAMIGANPCSITVTAIGTVSTARIDRELFMRVAREFPEFGTAVLRMLTEKLELAVGELGEARQLLQKARSFRSL